LISCSGIPLTGEGQKVREISPDWSNQCDLIGIREISNASAGASPGVCKKRALDEMKNKIGEIGGNAYVITHIRVYPCLMGGTTVTFEAYSCPDDKSISVTLRDEKMNTDTDDLYVKLKNLKKLLDEGIISQQEYDVQKKKILDNN
jgi:hypothetical protein